MLCIFSETESLPQGMQYVAQCDEEWRGLCAVIERYFTAARVLVSVIQLVIARDCARDIALFHKW